MVLVCFHCCRHSRVYAVLMGEWPALATRVIIINVRAVFFIIVVCAGQFSPGTNLVHHRPAKKAELVNDK